MSAVSRESDNTEIALAPYIPSRAAELVRRPVRLPRDVSGLERTKAQQPTDTKRHGHPIANAKTSAKASGTIKTTANIDVRAVTDVEITAAKNHAETKFR